MSKITATAFDRKFEKIPVFNAKGEKVDTKTIRRSNPIPPRARRKIRVEGCVLPVMISEGQEINPRKEKARQARRLGQKYY